MPFSSHNIYHSCQFHWTLPGYSDEFGFRIQFKTRLYWNIQQSKEWWCVIFFIRINKPLAACNELHMYCTCRMSLAKSKRLFYCYSIIKTFATTIWLFKKLTCSNDDIIFESEIHGICTCVGNGIQQIWCTQQGLKVKILQLLPYYSHYFDGLTTSIMSCALAESSNEDASQYQRNHRDAGGETDGNFRKTGCSSCSAFSSFYACRSA